MLRLNTLLVLMLILFGSLVSITAGCQPYTLRGWIVEGEVSDITLIDRDDPRITSMRAVRDAQIVLSRDPGRLSEAALARTRSDERGKFELPIDAFGAGWMDEQWRIQAAAQGYRNASLVLALPGNPNRRVVLITLAPGAAQPIEERHDPWQEHDRYR